MTLAVIDSSIVVKWIVQEQDSDDVVALRDFYSFAASELISAEASNAIVSKVRKGHLIETEAAAASELLSQLSIEFYPLQPLIEDAISIALTLQHPAYDCFFLALSRRLDCILVTADAALIRKSTGRKFHAITPPDALERVLCISPI